jgi:predicted component of type VI protein secretion system
MANYQVVMTKGPAPGKFFNLSGPNVTIGRDINADIVINIPEVSRRHAQFRLEGGVYLLEDLGSTNGTFVDGQRLTMPHRMRDGETITLGEAVTLMFRSSGPADPNATVAVPSNQAATMVASDPADFSSSDPADMYASDPYSAPAPMDFGVETPKEVSSSRTWLYAGLGCLLILLVGCVGVAVLFDAMNMYCQPPFDSLFSFLYTCP